MTLTSDQITSFAKIVADDHRVDLGADAAVLTRLSHKALLSSISPGDLEAIIDIARMRRVTSAERSPLANRVAVFLSVGLVTVYGLAPVPAEALPLAEWMHKPVLDAAGGTMAIVAALIVGAVMKLVFPSPRPTLVDQWNDNQPTLEERAREWEAR